MMAHLLAGERSQDFIQALERHWISRFGVPARLVTDEGRGWLHNDFQEWTDSQSIQHVVAAGEAHEQLALVERRHAVLRKALEIYLMDFGLEGANAIRQALSYVVPQLNNNPSTSGFSPSQWVLGQSPTFPGELLGTNLTPVHLDTPFEDELSRRAVAKMAIVQADADQKFRRTFLRKYAGTNIALSAGQTCFYWRDARAADLVKIRWKGPATVLMREDDDDGRPRVYWIGHKTQLLRCAPHHVRPEIGRSTSTLIGDLQVAKDMLQALKSRGVTRYSDLTIKNKRNIDDVDSGDEMLDDGDSDDDYPPSPKRRLVDPAVYEREALGISGFEHIEREMDFTPAPPSVPYSPSVASFIANDAEQPHPIGFRDQHQIPPGREEQAAGGDPPGLAVDPQAPGFGLLEPEQPGDGDTPVDGDTPPLHMQGDETDGQVPFFVEPSREPSPKTPQPPRLPQAAQLDPVTASYYEPATAEEFRAHRRRLEQQETMFFGPIRGRMFQSPTATSSSAMPAPPRPPDTHGAGPYSEPPKEEDHGLSVSEHGNLGHGFSAFDIDDLEYTALPPGWHVEDGYIVLNDTSKDYWEVKAGCLIRHHVVPRRTQFDINSISLRDKEHLPVPVDKLDNSRVTVCQGPSDVKHLCDNTHDPSKAFDKPWIGCTIFQINGDTRKDMGMHAYTVTTAKQLGKKEKTHAKRMIKRDQNKNDISERNLSLQDKILFHQAKVKELKLFFENGVWSFQTTREAVPNRTFTSRILLKWAKNADGTPRAKARLVVRGYTDADALAGRLDTASPASTRLGRSCLLSISSCLG